MRELRLMTSAQLQQRADELQREAFEVMKVLNSRGFAETVAASVDHASVKQPVEDLKV